MFLPMQWRHWPDHCCWRAAFDDDDDDDDYYYYYYKELPLAVDPTLDGICMNENKEGAVIRDSKWAGATAILSDSDRYPLVSFGLQIYDQRQSCLQIDTCRLASGLSPLLR